MIIEVLLLAAGSAVFPMLLAGVAVLLSREKPAPLLIAFWLGGFTTSITAGIIILQAFGERASSLGAKGPKLAPPYSVTAGVLIVAVAWLLGSKKGRSIIDGWRERRKEHKEAKGRVKAPKEGPSRSERLEQKLLGGGVVFAGVAGAILNLPGPFYLIALGDIATKHYPLSSEILLILLFNLIMLVLVEVPLVGFLIDPEVTDRKVESLAKWLNRNGIKIVAGIALVWGVSMIGKGVSDWGHWQKKPSAKKAQVAVGAPSSALYSAISFRSFS
jgi:hypothetical protein